MALAVASSSPALYSGWAQVVAFLPGAATCGHMYWGFAHSEVAVAVVVDIVEVEGEACRVYSDLVAQIQVSANKISFFTNILLVRRNVPTYWFGFCKSIIFRG